MTVREFRSDPIKVSHLAQIMRDPVFREAENLIGELLQPKVVSGVTTESAGLMGMYSAGGYSTFRSLKTLSTPIPEQSEELPEEFDGYMGGKLQHPEEIEKQIKRRRTRQKHSSDE